MSIGLSHKARLLLFQLVRAHQRGKHQHLKDDQLSFTLAVESERTTVAFASGERPIETSDVNAVMTLRANGLIEEFTTIGRTSSVPRYVVTQDAMMLVCGSTMTTDVETSSSVQRGSPTTEATNAEQPE